MVKIAREIPSFFILISSRAIATVRVVYGDTKKHHTLPSSSPFVNTPPIRTHLAPPAAAFPSTASVPLRKRGEGKEWKRTSDLRRAGSDSVDCARVDGLVGLGVKKATLKHLSSAMSLEIATPGKALSEGRRKNGQARGARGLLCTIFEGCGGFDESEHEAVCEA